MGKVFFYHLTHSPIEKTLPMLLAKSLEAGWRVTVRGTRPERQNWLDGKLWQEPEDGFLPHGLAGGAHDADQPILLTCGPGLPNAAQCLMTLDAAAVEPAECRAAQRVCIIFDGNDNDALQLARAQWQKLTGAGIAAQYWSEESGRWEKRAETPAQSEGSSP